MKNANKLLRTNALFITCLFLLVQASWADSIDADNLSNVGERCDTLRMSDKWLAKDKLEHLGVSAFFSGVSYSICSGFYNNKEDWSVYFSASFTLSLGLCKEIYDKKQPRGKFSYKDLVADAVGVGLGLLIATR